MCSFYLLLCFVGIVFYSNLTFFSSCQNNRNTKLKKAFRNFQDELGTEWETLRENYTGLSEDEISQWKDARKVKQPRTLQKQPQQSQRIKTKAPKKILKNSISKRPQRIKEQSPQLNQSQQPEGPEIQQPQTTPRLPQEGTSRQLTNSDYIFGNINIQNHGYNVAIWMLKADRNPICSGVLVTVTVVLTVNICLINNKTGLKLIAGCSRLSQFDCSERPVDSITIFKGKTELALAKVITPFRLSDKIELTPFCKLSYGLYQKVLDILELNANCAIFGWRFINSLTRSESIGLYKNSVILKQRNICSYILATFSELKNVNNLFCGEGAGKGIYRGTLGSPLVCANLVYGIAIALPMSQFETVFIFQKLMFDEEWKILFSSVDRPHPFIVKLLLLRIFSLI